MERPIGTPKDGGGVPKAPAPVPARAQSRRARAARTPAVAAHPGDPAQLPAPVAARKPRGGKPAMAAPPRPPVAARKRKAVDAPTPPETGATPLTTKAAPPAVVAAPAAPAAQARRFIEPYPFDDAHRRRLDVALADAGLTDATGRAIFIGAIAYELAVLKAASDGDTPARPLAAPALAPTPTAAVAAAAPGSAAAATSAASTQFVELASAAAALGRLLSDLGDAGRARLSVALKVADPFARAHGPDYLAAVRLEVGRIATASGDCANASPSDPAASPDLQPAPVKTATRSARSPVQPAPVLRFIAHAARVYRESFDRAPGSALQDPFVGALAAIGTVTDTPIPTTAAVLEQALGD